MQGDSMMGDRAVDPGDERTHSRAQALNSEEQRAGSDNAETQAATILAESDARMVDRVDPPGQPVEHRRSEDTVDLVDLVDPT